MRCGHAGGPQGERLAHARHRGDAIAATPRAPPPVVTPPPGQGRLNEFMALGRPAWRAAREQLQRLLATSEGGLRDDVALRDRVVLEQVGMGRPPCARMPRVHTMIHACVQCAGMGHIGDGGRLGWSVA